MTQLAQEGLLTSQTEEQIEERRATIDEYDDAILDGIIARCSEVQELGELKRNADLPIRNISRESEVLKRLRERAIEKGADPSIVGEVWSILFHHAIHSQEMLRQTGRQAILGNPAEEL